jgi:hypothetical protein
MSSVPPRLSRPPLYSLMPTTVKVRLVACGVRTPACSPIETSAAFASAALITISSAFAGARPARSCTRLSSPVQLLPNRGGPYVVTTLPLAPIMRAPSASTMPWAPATPGTAATVLTMAAGRPSVACSSSAYAGPSLDTGRTCTSVFSYTVANRPSNERPSVSVSTNAPDTNITPSTTARPDSTSRTFLESRLLRVAQITAQPSAATSRRFIVSSTDSAVGSRSSLTTAPSARKITRSA